MENRYFRVINTKTGAIIAEKAKITKNFKERSIGLLNRKILEPGEALLIKPCNSIHTFFMRFPIDVAFLTKEGKVVGIVKDMAAWRFASCILEGYMTLEMPTGSIERCYIRIGDLLSFKQNS